MGLSDDEGRRPDGSGSDDSDAESTAPSAAPARAAAATAAAARPVTGLAGGARLPAGGGGGAGVVLGKKSDKSKNMITPGDYAARLGLSPTPAPGVIRPPIGPASLAMMAAQSAVHRCFGIPVQGKPKPGYLHLLVPKCVPGTLQRVIHATMRGATDKQPGCIVPPGAALINPAGARVDGKSPAHAALAALHMYRESLDKSGIQASVFQSPAVVPVAVTVTASVLTADNTATHLPADVELFGVPVPKFTTLPGVATTFPLAGSTPEQSCVFDILAALPAPPHPAARLAHAACQPVFVTDPICFYIVMHIHGHLGQFADTPALRPPGASADAALLLEEGTVAGILAAFEPFRALDTYANPALDAVVAFALASLHAGHVAHVAKTKKGGAAAPAAWYVDNGGSFQVPVAFFDMVAASFAENRGLSRAVMPEQIRAHVAITPIPLIAGRTAGFSAVVSTDLTFGPVCALAFFVPPSP